VNKFDASIYTSNINVFVRPIFPHRPTSLWRDVVSAPRAHYVRRTCPALLDCLNNSNSHRDCLHAAYVTRSMQLYYDRSALVMLPTYDCSHSSRAQSPVTIIMYCHSGQILHTWLSSRRVSVFTVIRCSYMVFTYSALCKHIYKFDIFNTRYSA